jgi:hypothetical protein
MFSSLIHQYGYLPALEKSNQRRGAPAPVSRTSSAYGNEGLMQNPGSRHEVRRLVDQCLVAVTRPS